TRPGGHEADAHASSGAGIASRHEARALLIRGHDQWNLCATHACLLLVVEEDGIVGRQDGAAAIAENGPDTLIGQHLYDHPGTGQGLAGKRMPERAGLNDGVAHTELSKWARNCGRVSGD